MKLLLDVNVILDVVLARDPWAEDAARLLAAIHRGEHDGWVAGHTVTTAHYLVERARDTKAAAVAVTDLLDLVDIAPVAEPELRRALAVDADAIVSRDAAGFEGCGVAVLGAAAA